MPDWGPNKSQKVTENMAEHEPRYQHRFGSTLSDINEFRKGKSCPWRTINTVTAKSVKATCF